jgi:hypothetical protein
MPIVYIATKFERKAEAAALAAQLAERGYVFAHDWTKHEKVPFDYVQGHGVAAGQAAFDLAGAAGCDAFVLLTDAGGLGCWVELGAALAHYQSYGKPRVYVVGPYAERTIFCYHPAAQQVPTVEALLTEGYL